MKRKIIITLGVIVTVILAFYGVLWFHFTRSSRYGTYLEREYEREMWNWQMLRQKELIDTFRTAPLRSEIIDELGNVIAQSKMVYDLRFDAVVYDKEDWEAQFRGLSGGMAEIFDDLSADELNFKLRDGRQKGRRYLKIKEGVDSADLARVRTLPLCGKDYPLCYKPGFTVGGLIVEQRQGREYPYGELARRTIGIYRNNPEFSRNVGLEGAFNEMLSGKDGYKVRRTWWSKPFYKKRAQRNQKIIAQADAIQGEKLYTTLNMELQALADSALRAAIGKRKDIAGATMVIMTPGRGAVAAMVNLSRYQDNPLGEYYNVAIGHSYEPGQLLYPAVKLTDAKVGTEPRLEYAQTLDHILNGEHSRKRWEIAGLMDVSLPDLERTPAALENLRRGYGMSATALDFLTLYNAIASKGEGRYPWIAYRNEPLPFDANYTICTPAQAEELTKELVDNAKAAGMDGTRYTIAGMTGSSRELQSYGYVDEHGRTSYQSTFAGFFPAEDPQYSIICMVYSDPVKGSIPTAGIPQKAVRTVIDNINLD